VSLEAQASFLHLLSSIITTQPPWFFICNSKPSLCSAHR
jgi:hypothetical protein